MGRQGTIGLGILVGIAMLCGVASEASAARYAVRCVATPWCQISCSSNVRAVACHARILPNGRCFKRCVKAAY
jgi:hypothetical protein